MKHTKAPWKWEYKSGFIKIISSNDDVLEDLNKEYNAKLIAAAPELLQCVKEMNTLLAILTNKEIGSEVAQELINRIESHDIQH